MPYGYARSPRRRPLPPEVPPEVPPASACSPSEVVVGPEAVAEYPARVVAVPSASVKRAPRGTGRGSELAVRLGESLVVTGRCGGEWLKCRAEDGTVGWVRSKCVQRTHVEAGATTATARPEEGAVAALAKCHGINTASLEDGLHATRLSAAALRQRRRRVRARLGIEKDPTLAITTAYRPVIADALGIDGETAAPANTTKRKDDDDDLDAMDEETLTWELERLDALLAVAEDGASAMAQDLADSRRWERYESGRETRDVLANGERRALMEARLGREVTKADIENGRSLTWEEKRRHAVEGMDALEAKGYVARLPVPIGDEEARLIDEARASLRLT